MRAAFINAVSAGSASPSGYFRPTRISNKKTWCRQDLDLLTKVANTSVILPYPLQNFVFFAKVIQATNRAVGIIAYLRA